MCALFRLRDLRINFGRPEYGLLVTWRTFLKTRRPLLVLCRRRLALTPREILLRVAAFNLRCTRLRDERLAMRDLLISTRRLRPVFLSRTIPDLRNLLTAIIICLSV